jgi:uncharacterized membrane protein YfcA
MVEKRSTRLSQLNLGGLIEGLSGPAGIIVGAISGSLGLGLGIASVSLMKWILGQLYNQRSNSESIGVIYDSIVGTVTDTSAETAFVARINRNMKR